MPRTINDRVMLTPGEAISLLPDGETIHTYVNPGTGILVGADWDRKKVLDLIESTHIRELGGEHCQAMKHGLVLWLNKHTPLFVESRPAESAIEYDPGHLGC